uniref:Uncharacterized protein n=1 Tax=Arundo donax TaxID=35708 RepID=A0A0A9B1C4_ARUDO
MTKKMKKINNPYAEGSAEATW